MTEDEIKQRYLTTKQAAVFLGKSRGTLDNWRCKDKGPPWIEDGRIYYDIKDLIEYMTKHKVWEG